MLKRKKLIRFGDAIIIEGFYAYKKLSDWDNVWIGIMYGIVPPIIQKTSGLKSLKV